MRTRRESPFAQVGIDGVALKPTEHRLSLANDLDVDLVTVDFEGREHVPDSGELRRLADHCKVRVTIPVRVDGFDPLVDDSSVAALPERVGRVLVAGHPTYLQDEERNRAIGPRLQAAARDSRDPWIGTEGIQRLALAVGGTQFDLLSGTTARDVRALRQAGVEEPIAVYAPTVFSSDPDKILDGVGSYVARRRHVSSVLPSGAATDSQATGFARDRLLAAAEDYALVGHEATISDRVSTLTDAGVNTVVAYPADGLEAI